MCSPNFLSAPHIQEKNAFLLIVTRGTEKQALLLAGQPRSQSSLLRRVGENPGKEVDGWLQTRHSSLPLKEFFICTTDSENLLIYTLTINGS